MPYPSVQRQANKKVDHSKNDHGKACYKSGVSVFDLEAFEGAESKIKFGDFSDKEDNLESTFKSCEEFLAPRDLVLEKSNSLTTRKNAFDYK